MNFVHMSFQDCVSDECHITGSTGVLLLRVITSSIIRLGYLQSPSSHLEYEVREAEDGKTQDNYLKIIRLFQEGIFLRPVSLLHKTAQCPLCFKISTHRLCNRVVYHSVGYFEKGRYPIKFNYFTIQKPHDKAY